MVQAYILIQTEVGKARDVATAIRGVDELGKMIVSKVQLVPGITRTLTCSVVHL